MVKFRTGKNWYKVDRRYKDSKADVSDRSVVFFFLPLPLVVVFYLTYVFYLPQTNIVYYSLLFIWWNITFLCAHISLFEDEDDMPSKGKFIIVCNILLFISWYIINIMDL